MSYEIPEIDKPLFITYAPNRIAGKWRMHETVGHLRNSVRNNGNYVEAVYVLHPDGIWEWEHPDSVFSDYFKERHSE